MFPRTKRPALLLVVFASASLAATAAWIGYRKHFQALTPASHAPMLEAPARLSPFQRAITDDLNRQCASNIVYEDGYYTGGEPPPRIGVCTDVVIRSFRAAGVNLQREVATDIRQNPTVYHIGRPDPNIDHRRCRNLTIFFHRHAQILPASGPNADWEPGDVVFWDTSGDGQAHHVGVIANHLGASGDPTVTHHWPGQVVSEMDWLYRLQTLSHYRWNANGAEKPGHPV